MPTIMDHIKTTSWKFYAKISIHPHPSIAETGIDYEKDTPIKYKLPKLVLMD